MARTRAEYDALTPDQRRAVWWEPSAAEAAAAAGIPMHDWSKVVRSETTAWGEGINYDAAGNEVSATNPEWVRFVNSYQAPAAAPAEAPMVNQPTSGSTRSVLGAEQDPTNPWDPTLVRRNQYDVGY
jgi:hypothetical protein